MSGIIGGGVMADVEDFLIKSDRIVLSDMQQAAIEAALVMVKDWLFMRYKKGSFINYSPIGLDLINYFECEKALQSFYHIKVLIAPRVEFNQLVKKIVQDGIVHLKSSQKFQTSDENEALSSFMSYCDHREDFYNNKQMTAEVLQYIEEPIVFLTDDDVSKIDLLRYCVAHKIIIALKLLGCEDEVRDGLELCLKEGVIYDDYWDSEKEILVRLKKLRKDMALDLAQVVTDDDIRQIEDTIQQRLNSSDDAAQIAYHLYDRYKNKCLVEWLNFVSDLDDEKDIFELVRAEKNDLSINVNHLRLAQEFKSLRNYIQEKVPMALSKFSGSTESLKDGLVKFFKDCYKRSQQ
ncbi:MAG: hypothetical protein IJ864_03865 [Alphaproteobacteria bacterium]|nr:hypothetical protein [Alphaproteobacteria bacterium]